MLRRRIQIPLWAITAVALAIFGLNVSSELERKSVLSPGSAGSYESEVTGLTAVSADLRGMHKTKAVFVDRREGVQGNVAVSGVAARVGVTINKVPVGDANADQIGGATIENLSPPVAQQLGFPPTMPAVLVTDVDPSSPAGASGLRPGDVIVAVNNTSVESVSELKDTIWWMGLTPVVFSVVRDGDDYIFTFPVW